MKESDKLISDPIDFTVSFDKNENAYWIKTDETGMKILTLLLDSYALINPTDDAIRSLETLQ